MHFIFFTFCWVATSIIVVMVVDLIRIKSGSKVSFNDPISAAMIGFTFGPIGMLAAFSKRSRVYYTTIPMLIGGSIGTGSYLYYY